MNSTGALVGDSIRASWRTADALVTQARQLDAKCVQLMQLSQLVTRSLTRLFELTAHTCWV